MGNELQKFKDEINLAEYAASRGYTLDKKKSTKNSIVMVRNGEKIGISINKRTGDQNYNNFGTGTGGTVIDFSQKETGKNLGQTRKELRTYLGSPRPQIQIAPPRPRPTAKAQATAMAVEKANFKPIQQSQYLESRGISQKTIDDPRFKSQINFDNRSNICFPHYNSNGFSGCEKKNYQYTGFTKNGEKGLWYSKAPGDFEKIIVCESGIDALSHAQLHPGNKAAYISIGGQMSHEQENFLSDLVDRNKDKTIVAGFDNDEQGQRYAHDLERICQEKGVSFDFDLPKVESQDWNEQLQAQAQAEAQAQDEDRENFAAIGRSGGAYGLENEEDYGMEM